MHVRFAIPEDTEALIELGRLMAEETRPGFGFDLDKWRSAVEGSFSSASPTFFVCEDKGEIVGFLKAFIQRYSWTDGFLASQELWFVRPDKRGTRAAVRLFRAFVAWGIRIKAKELYAGVASPVHPERTVEIMKHFGFAPVGATLRRLGHV